MTDDSAAGDDHLRLPERTNHPYDAPGPADLIDVVARYLRHDLLDRVQGHDRWTLRVAANALTIAAREIESTERHGLRYQQRLDDLGFDSDRTLSEAIRSGAVDSRWDEVVEAVFANVCDSLSVANPGYARDPEHRPGTS